MPFIHFSTSKRLDESTKAKLSAKIAECVKLLPGKPANRTMIRIDESCSIYRDGESAECAFIQTTFQNPLVGEDQKNYIEALYVMLKDFLSLEVPQIYCAMVPLETWGSRGTLQLEPYTS